MRFVRLLAVLSTLPGCGSSGSGEWLVDTGVLVQGVDVVAEDCRSNVCRHNENTDLIAWKGAIYLVHRTAMSQVLGPNSSLRVYRTTDGGKSFDLLAILPAPDGRDLRDPSLFVVGDRLAMKALTRLPVTSARDTAVDTITVETTSADGVTWTPFVGVAPKTWSFWRVKEQAGMWYSAAYEDGDRSIVMFSSTDGTTWRAGATVLVSPADTVLEAEIVFMPSGRMLVFFRMDGTDEELLGNVGRLRTKVCWAAPPYDSFSCPQELTGVRLDGPVAFRRGSRLFVV